MSGSDRRSWEWCRRALGRGGRRRSSPSLEFVTTVSSMYMPDFLIIKFSEKSLTYPIITIEVEEESEQRYSGANTHQTLGNAVPPHTAYDCSTAAWESINSMQRVLGCIMPRCDFIVSFLAPISDLPFGELLSGFLANVRSISPRGARL